MAESERYDVVVVGGGPAGLSAALMLGRARLRVVVVDAGRPRNRKALEMHGFLGRDGAAPVELVRAGRAEVERYGVIVREGTVCRAVPEAQGFRVELADGTRLRCRRLLLATGVEDPLPTLPGLAELYGVSVHHCPFCDGWEERDRALAVYGRGAPAARYALELTRWSRDVVLLTDGPSRLRLIQRRLLARHRIPVCTEAIVRLEGRAGRLERVVFARGEPLAREALFFLTRPRQTCDLGAALGVRFTDKGMMRTDRAQGAGIPRLYVAGDACRDVQLAVVSAAQGVKAAVAIVGDLDRERLGS